MLNPLSADELYGPCETEAFGFESTAEVPFETRVLGQPRAVRALSFGLNMGGAGYHIFVAGQPGSGRESVVERLVGERASQGGSPDDWAYVYNFEAPGRPKALRLPSGQGAVLERRMARLVDDVRLHLWGVGEAEDFRRALDENWDQLQSAKQDQLSQFEAQARLEAASRGSSIGGEQVAETPRDDETSPQEERWGALGEPLAEDWERGLRTVGELEKKTRAAGRDLIASHVGVYLRGRIERLRRLYSDNPGVRAYCEDVYRDILDQLEEKSSPWRRRDDSGVDLDSLEYERYEINVIVDHSDGDGPPVVREYAPMAARLLGHVAHEPSAKDGNGGTDYRRIRPGALHAANGGYLVLRMRDLFSETEGWRALKRALLEGQVRLEDSTASVSSRRGILAPESIPLQLKVILIGSSTDYDWLYDRDEDFGSLFKVMVDFDEHMPRTAESESEYVAFIAALCEGESLPPLDASGVGRVIEFGSWLAESQDKLSTRFGRLADLIREAGHWAELAGRAVVTAEDLGRAIEEHKDRHARVRSERVEEILQETVLIATDGEAIGQVNGLTIVPDGPYEYGLPSRITARTFMGKEGVVQIDREVELAGPLHNKGLLTLVGFLGGTYATQMPLSLSAQITFEQNYGDIDGDSAASTELFALLSSLSGIPIKQGIAVTGSVNQLGEIQAIGGVTEKVEGWFDICAKRGLNGEQGVVVPKWNVKDLMLEQAARDAVRAGQFHVWAVTTVDEGLEILTGREASEIHAAAHRRMRVLAEGLESFGKEEHGDEEDD